MSAASSGPRPPKVDQGPAYRRFSDLTDGPLTVLAFLLVPILVIPLALRLPAGVMGALNAVDVVIWALFVVEFGAKLYLARHRWVFIRTHVPDLILVVIPFLRPLRATRILRGIRAVSGAGKALDHLSRLLRHRGLNYVLLLVVVLVFLAAGFELSVERHALRSNIHTFPDALWWAVTTITTVGYGDRFPVTAAGRGIAVVLMVGGIALFGIVTATLASYFTEARNTEADGRLDEIAERLSRLEDYLVAALASAPSPPLRPVEATVLEPVLSESALSEPALSASAD